MLLRNRWQLTGTLPRRNLTPTELWEIRPRTRYASVLRVAPRLMTSAALPADSRSAHAILHGPLITAPTHLPSRGNRYPAPLLTHTNLRIARLPRDPSPPRVLARQSSASPAARPQRRPPLALLPLPVGIARPRQPPAASRPLDHPPEATAPLQTPVEGGSRQGPSYHRCRHNGTRSPNSFLSQRRSPAGAPEPYRTHPQPLPAGVLVDRVAV